MELYPRKVIVVPLWSHCGPINLSECGPGVTRLPLDDGSSCVVDDFRASGMKQVRMFDHQVLHVLMYVLLGTIDESKPCIGVVPKTFRYDGRGSHVSLAYPGRTW
jgi:hypothetical protein